ncbi:MULTISPECIES: alpha/beta hydrolase [unclassified Streptomyces]|uniref:alpha/beta hydrolase n=1 Tax=unclassified Streptomyces TaxID=2593676 RepID=UPI000DAB6633|nr:MULTISPECIES: alpha/beta hydrolase [unclassified Streptomyces]PZT71726.1 alpha/beta hydrolase [Streptomyces sp. AC1-42T]PZT73148.1 alpha/beta hydrolase [Streptomyces sp. AC1-42W]
MRNGVPRAARLLAAGLTAATLLTATAACAPPAPVTSAGEAGAVPAALRVYTQQKLRWEPCDLKEEGGLKEPGALRCTTVKVPLDYMKPGGKKIAIAISRLRASDPKKRRGVLLLNPGGPGAPGLGLPVDPLLKLPQRVKQRYDLIGFDPRGTGRSAPVSCGLTAGEQADHPYRAATFAKDVAWARTVAAKCRAAAGRELAHLTTRNSARDMDVIRAALGEKRISYLGVSYGTYLGAVYTQLFPRRADRFVLDSATDPGRVYRGMFQDMAKAAEDAFSRWAGWTARRNGEYGLGATPAAVRAAFWDLVAQADREPVLFEGQPLSGADIRSNSRVFVHVREAAAWITGLREAAANGGAKEPGRSETSGESEESGASGPSDDGYVSAAWSYMCADSRSWSHDPEQYRREAIRDQARYPLYGDFAAAVAPCAFWQRGTEPQTVVDNGVGALITQNEWDPQTPLASGRAMHRALRGSRMLTVTGGEGHGVLYAPDGNACADEAATAYLLTGRLPDHDLTCRAAPPRTGTGTA